MISLRQVIHVIDPVRGVPGAKVKEKERQREEKAKREAEMLVLDTIDPLIRIKGLSNLNTVVIALLWRGAYQRKRKNSIMTRTNIDKWCLKDREIKWRCYS